MVIMRHISIFLIIASMIFSLQAYSQSECQEDIDQANKLFDEGSFRQSEKLTRQVLETCELNKTQENEMLKLLASIYYEMDEIESGDEYVAEFMKKNPYYIVSKRNDSPQFRNAIKKLKSFPSFSLSFRGGVPLGWVTTQKIYPIFDKADYTEDYTIKPVFQSGLEMGWNMISSLSLNLGAGVRIQTILHQVPQYDQLYFNYEEQNISTVFPLYLGFSIPLSGKFDIKFMAGGEFEMFTSGKFNYFYTADSDITTEMSFYLNRKRSNIIIDKNERSQFRYGVLGGIRLTYKIERFAIFTEARYIQELKIFNNPEKRFIDQDLYLANYYALSDIMLQNLDLSLGLIYNFSYKVKSKY
jgi:hypothetical protein